MCFVVCFVFFSFKLARRHKNRERSPQHGTWADECLIMNFLAMHQCCTSDMQNLHAHLASEQVTERGSICQAEPFAHRAQQTCSGAGVERASEYSGSLTGSQVKYPLRYCGAKRCSRADHRETNVFDDDRGTMVRSPRRCTCDDSHDTVQRVQFDWPSLANSCICPMYEGRAVRLQQHE